jgi:hypothetical protein
VITATLETAPEETDSTKGLKMSIAEILYRPRMITQWKLTERK